jgi:transposase
MLGPPKPRRLDQPIAVSLEDLIPRDHFYRHLDAKLDLGFVREWARDLYADRGRPSIDPVVFFKLQLVMFFEALRSERTLVETASLNLAHRWYLGYALDEPLPDHSSLTRIRQRLGLAVFARFFEQVVDLCQDADLVWGRELFFNATRVRADAALGSLVPRFAHEATTHVADLFADGAPAGGGDEADPGAPPLPAAGSGPGENLLSWPVQPSSAGESAAADHPRWDLLAERRLDPDRPVSRGYQRVSAWWVSATDPDASPMRADGRAVLGYHDHDVVDGGTARIILAALLTPADVMENQPMQDLLWRVRFRRKLHPRQVTGDTTYGTVEHIVAIEDQHIRAYVPLPDLDHRTPYYGPSSFRYDAGRDEYRCPEGHPMPRIVARPEEATVVYRAAAATCNACPVKPACTASAQGRTVRRSVHADEMERVQGYHATEAYQKAMRKRQVLVEPHFAEAKEWHGLRRFRLRGLDNVNMEGLLIAAGQNLKRFLAATGWRRRHAPCGSLVALPGSLLRPTVAPG